MARPRRLPAARGDRTTTPLVSVERDRVSVGASALTSRGGSEVEEERQGGRGIYWLLKNVLLGPVMRRLFRPVEEGVGNVPADGPAILACNHLSYIDWLFVPMALDRRVTFVAKADYFTGVGVKGWAQRRFFAGTGQVPIDRSGGRASQGALLAGLRILQHGELFAIFPEGTRSHDGRLYKGRTGVARLALTAKVPVIPAAVIGTDVIAPPGRLLSRIVSPTIKFGTPLDFSRYDGLAEDRFVLRSVTDEIMYAIMELSGQIYVDQYATAARERAAAAARERGGTAEPSAPGPSPEATRSAEPSGRPAQEPAAERGREHGPQASG